MASGHTNSSTAGGSGSMPDSPGRFRSSERGGGAGPSSPPWLGDQQQRAVRRCCVARKVWLGASRQCSRRMFRDSVSRVSSARPMHGAFEFRM